MLSQPFAKSGSEFATTVFSRFDACTHNPSNEARLLEKRRGSRLAEPPLWVRLTTRLAVCFFAAVFGEALIDVGVFALSSRGKS